MILKSDDISQWFEKFEDVHPEYREIKVWHTIQCYRLQGRKTVISLDNFEPIPDLHYALYSPKEKRYYFKTYPQNIPLWLMMFYDPNGTWDSYDAITNSLRKYISDGTMYLLLTPEQISDTTQMLCRLWKSQLKGEGKLDYKIYLQIMEKTLLLEDYKSYGKELVGFKTVQNQMQLEIDALWKSAYELKR
jgi:hypothetical protein